MDRPGGERPSLAALAARRGKCASTVGTCYKWGIVGKGAGLRVWWKQIQFRFRFFQVGAPCTILTSELLASEDRGGAGITGW